MRAIISLRPRLAAIADAVGGNRRLVIDVGTDHGYLPIYLVQSGLAERAIASDIAVKPLKRAEAAIAEQGCADRIALPLGNGLSGLEDSGADCVVIAGMGGEMIADILENAPFVRQRQIDLVLQPMTRAEVLRRYLAEHGFAVTSEHLVSDDKLYQILSVRYDGIRRSISPFLAAVGEGNLVNRSVLLPIHLARLRQIYLTRLEGKRRAGIDASEEVEILSGIAEAEKEICHDGR